MIEGHGSSAELVAHIHSKRVIHRDLKSANLLLSSQPSSQGHIERVKLGDFGIAVDSRRKQPLSSRDPPPLHNPPQPAISRLPAVL